MTKRKRRTFSKEFKKQIVQLHASGKPRSEIIKEYELTRLLLIDGLASITHLVLLKKRQSSPPNRKI